jgi:radical SAM superfamily enzyme YgiQ (UPF0313 family)
LNNVEDKKTFNRLCAYHQSKFPQYLNINKQGYYETALYDYSNQILSRINDVTNQLYFEKVPNLAYRSKGKITTNQQNRVFSQIDIVKPDYTDYFRFMQDNKINTIQPLIPVESSRGCHWNQCKFCFLTEGYANRVKDNDAILDEIIQSIKSYKIFEFVFLDNDIIFNDKEKFDDLLNQFIKIKGKYEEFGIWNGEVVTKENQQEEFILK